MKKIVARAGVLAASLVSLALLPAAPASGASAGGFGTPAFGPGTATAGPVGTAYLAAIATAKKTLDVTSFEVTDPNVIAGLQAAAAKGVKVRVITDSSYTGNAPFVSQLKGTRNISVALRAGSNATGIMHSKYTVIDGKAVWTGSANLSPGGMRVNAENGLEVKSSALAADYEADFAEMWAGKWGNAKTGEPRHKTVSIADGKGGKVKVDVYFSGQQGKDEIPAIAAIIAGAKSSVHVFAYEFTQSTTTQPMIDALAAAAKRGVDVRAIFDDSTPIEANANASTIAAVKSAGGETVEWHPSWGLCHNKCVIVDGATVEMGSLNYTQLATGTGSSAGNDENFLVIHGDATIGAAYEATFSSIWAKAGGKP